MKFMKIKTLCLVLLSGLITIISSCNNSNNTDKKTTTTNDIETVKEINPVDTFSYTDYNSAARILAGKYPTDTLFLVDIVKSSAFKNHNSTFDKIWSNHILELNKISDWISTNLESEDTVFYPFGGPDFNYLNAFFPNTRFSVMIGLEKAGKIPFSDSLSIANYNKILEMVNQTIVTNIGFSFFRTISMKRDLAGYLEGTLPIVMMFMSRHNYDILNINPVIINNEGFFEVSQPESEYAYTMNKDFGDAYEIIYKNPDDDFNRKLYYLSMDVCDSAINEQTFGLMMQNYFANQTTFLKAASYLLDRPQFSIIKQMILANSYKILTGPSGMQYRDFDESWDIKLYGNYVGPIRLFYDRQQPELKEAYKNGKPEKIDFLFDYTTGSPSLFIATKKSE
jgi:hypothetical protein